MHRYGCDTVSRLWRTSIRAISTLVAGVVVALLLPKFLTSFVLKADPYYIYVTAIAIVVSILVSHKLELAIVVYAFLAPFVALASPGYSGSRSGYQPSVMPSQVGLVVISGIWIAKAYFKKKAVLPKCSLYMPFLAFMFVCAMSIASTYVTWDYDIPLTERRSMNQVAETGLFALCGLAFWLAASAIQKKEWIKALSWPVILVGLYSAIFRILGFEGPINIVRGEFITGFAAAMLLARLLFLSERKVVRRRLWFLLFVISSSLLFNLGWVSGWLMSAIAIGIVVLFKSRKAFTALAVFGFIVMFIYPGVFSNIYADSRAQGDMDRFTLWTDSMNMANKVNPILGIGPGQYMSYAQKYGTLWYGPNTYTNAHSSFAQVVAETGYLGFAAFLWVLFAGFRVGIRATRKVSSEYQWFAVASTAIFMAMSITSLVGDYILPSRTNGGLNSFGTSVFPWLLLGATTAAVRLTAGQRTEQTSPSDISEPMVMIKK